jgi:hypothetical protein
VYPAQIDLPGRPEAIRRLVEIGLLASLREAEFDLTSKF